MRHLFVVRHGHYQGTDLTPRGRRQIEVLAEEMRARVGPGARRIRILSSTAPRAKQTARIVADVFGRASFDREECLRTSGGDDLSPVHLGEIDRLVAPLRARYDVIVICSHYEVVGSWARHAAKTLLGLDEEFDAPAPGEAVHLDLTERSCRILPEG